MTVQKQFTDLVKWVEDNIATKHMFKVPPSKDKPSNGKYEYQLAHPAVYPIFYPVVKNNGNDQIQDAPFILVQLLDGSMNPALMQGVMRIRLVFQIWDPGEHGLNKLTPDADGYKGVLALTDTTLAALHDHRILNGYRVKDDSISYGFAKWEDAIINSYPFYSGSIDFEMETINTNQPQQFKELL